MAYGGLRWTLNAVVLLTAIFVSSLDASTLSVRMSAGHLAPSKSATISPFWLGLYHGTFDVFDLGDPNEPFVSRAPVGELQPPMAQSGSTTTPVNRKLGDHWSGSSWLSYSGTTSSLPDRSVVNAGTSQEIKDAVEITESVDQESPRTNSALNTASQSGDLLNRLTQDPGDPATAAQNQLMDFPSESMPEPPSAFFLIAGLAMLVVGKRSGRRGASGD